MQHANTLRISLASLQRVIAARAGAPEEPSPLRVPDPSLTGPGQAIDLLDCIDEALTWAERPMQTATRVSRTIPGRAAALGLSTPQLRALVEMCLGDAEGRTVDPRPLLPEAAGSLIDDLETIAASLHAVRTRARVANKHVMRLALQAPGLARRARQHQGDANAETWAATKAWLDGLSERAKAHADRARSHLGGLPTQAQMLQRSLAGARVPRGRRRRPKTSLRRTTERMQPVGGGSHDA